MAKDDVTEREGFVFFCGGWPSQWYPSPFVIDGIGYLCCEQYMMAEKARLFGDEEMLAKILAADEPKEHKAFGRQVKPFDEERWNAVCREVVYRGNLAKFSQSDGLRSLLFATGDKILVEASPTDRIWGIGLGAEDPSAIDPSQWRGKNWLGEAIMRARATLRSELIAPNA